MTRKQIEKVLDLLENTNVQAYKEDELGDTAYSLDNCVYQSIENLRQVLYEMERHNLTKI